MQSASSEISKAQQQLARVRNILSKSRETLDYKIESAQVDFTEEVLSTMAEKGISEADLARRLGVSSPYTGR